MIIWQISPIVIFVLKNKIYKMKHTKILSGFFVVCLFLNQILTMFTKFYEEWKKNMKSTKKNPTITKNQHIPDQHEGLTLL